MANLLLRYFNNPTRENAVKIARYERAHMMAVCLLSKEQIAVLDKALAHAKQAAQ